MSHPTSLSLIYLTIFTVTCHMSDSLITTPVMSITSITTQVMSNALFTISATWGLPLLARCHMLSHVSISQLVNLSSICPLISLPLVNQSICHLINLTLVNLSMRHSTVHFGMRHDICQFSTWHWAIKFSTTYLVLLLDYLPATSNVSLSPLWNLILHKLQVD